MNILDSGGRLIEHIELYVCVCGICYFKYARSDLVLRLHYRVLCHDPCCHS